MVPPQRLLALWHGRCMCDVKARTRVGSRVGATQGARNLPLLPMHTQRKHDEVGMAW